MPHLGELCNTCTCIWLLMLLLCVCRWGVLCFMVIKLSCRLEFMWTSLKTKPVKNDDDVYILILNLLLEIVNAIEVVTLLNVEDLMWVVRELPSWVWSTYLFTNEYKNIMIRTCVNSVKNKQEFEKLLFKQLHL